MADQDGRRSKMMTLFTSCDVISPFCKRLRKQFWTYYLPTKSHCHSFNALEVLKGGRICKTKPRLNGDKECKAGKVMVTRLEVECDDPLELTGETGGLTTVTKVKPH